VADARTLKPERIRQVAAAARAHGKRYNVEVHVGKSFKQTEWFVREFTKLAAQLHAANATAVRLTDRLARSLTVQMRELPARPRAGRRPRKGSRGSP
jgi:hypothetical protein